MKKKRNFQIVKSSIEDFKGWKVTIPIHTSLDTNKLPIFMLTKRTKINNPYIMLLGGIHGEEPCGVYTLLDCKELLEKYNNKYNFILLPCVNPWGFIYNKRCNRKVHNDKEGLDNANEQFFDDTKDRIVHCIMTIYNKYKPKIVIDVHEDDDKELSVFEEGYPYISIKQFEKLVDIYSEKLYEGDEVKDGVILTGQEERTIEWWAKQKGSKLTVTIELPSKIDQFGRIYLGKCIIEKVLKN